MGRGRRRWIGVLKRISPWCILFSLIVCPGNIESARRRRVHSKQSAMREVDAGRDRAQ